MIKHLSNTKRSYSVVERSQFTGTSENRQNFFFVRFSGTQLSKEVTSFSRFENWFLLSFVMMWKWEMSMSIKMLERHKDHSTMYVWNTDSFKKNFGSSNWEEINISFPEVCGEYYYHRKSSLNSGIYIGFKMKTDTMKWYASVVFIWSGDIRNQLNFL